MRWARGPPRKRKGDGVVSVRISGLILALARPTQAQTTCNRTQVQNATSGCESGELGDQCSYTCAPGFGDPGAQSNQNESAAMLVCSQNASAVSSPPAWVHVNGTGLCTPCPALSQSSGHGIVCTGCGVGWEPTPNSTGCQRCADDSISDGTRCTQCTQWARPNAAGTACDTCVWAAEAGVDLCDAEHGSHCQNVAVPATCHSQFRNHSLVDGGECVGYACSACPTGFTGRGYNENFHLKPNNLSHLVAGSCCDLSGGCDQCKCTDIDECAVDYEPGTDPSRPLKCPQLATCSNFGGGRNCSCRAGDEGQLYVDYPLDHLPGADHVGATTSGTIELFPPCSNVSARQNCTRPGPGNVLYDAWECIYQFDRIVINYSSCKALWDSGTPAKPLPDKQWTLRDSMLRDGKFKSASKFSMAARGEKPFSWVGALTESDEARTRSYFPPPNEQTRVRIPTGFDYTEWNEGKGTCQDVDECVMPDPDRGGGLVPSKVCSKLYPNGLYPKRSLLQKLYTKLYTTFDDADLLQHYCNATHDKQVCGESGGPQSFLDRFKLNDNSNHMDITGLASDALTAANNYVNGESDLLHAPYCVNTIGSFACCMDYKDLAANPELRDGAGFPFTKDEHERWYPPVCKAIDWCNKSALQSIAEPGSSDALWLDGQKGGCDSNTDCIKLDPPSQEEKQKSEDWNGVNCGDCPVDMYSKWRARPDCEGHETCEAVSPNPAKLPWERHCRSKSTKKENGSIMTYGAAFFLFVCCCGMCKTNRSLSMELSEARQHEAQKLVLENFEDHARTISCAVHVEEDDEVEFTVETMVNPATLGRMGRAKLRNFTRHTHNVTARGLDMVEGLTSTVVDHVPGGNYTRQQLTGVLDRIEDATNGVVDAVPGANVGRQILSEGLNMVPGREFLPGRLGGGRRVL